MLRFEGGVDLMAMLDLPPILNKQARPCAYSLLKLGCIDETTAVPTSMDIKMTCAILIGIETRELARRDTLAGSV